MRAKLQYLSNGPAVVDLQNLLNQALPQAMPKLVADGKFGDRTLQRVKAYQQSRGLAVDGIVGANTWAALDGHAPAKAPIANSAAAGVIGHKLKGIQDGASTACIFGTARGTLKVSGLPRPACIADCRPYVNIAPFGMCRSMANPMVSAGTMAAQGVMTPAPCIPVIPGAWTPDVGFELVGTPPLPSIGRSSVLMCQWGGLISIV